MAICFSMSRFHARNKVVSCDEIRWGLIGSLVNYFDVIEANHVLDGLSEVSVERGLGDIPKWSMC